MAQSVNKDKTHRLRGEHPCCGDHGAWIVSNKKRSEAVYVKESLENGKGACNVGDELC